MATAHKRISRKALRQPDWFQIATEQAYEFYEAHRLRVFAGAGAAIILLLAIWGWQAFRDYQNAKAADAFGTAAELYHQERYREAIPAFANVESYRWSRYAMFAYLYQANSYLAVNDFNNALTAAQRFLDATSPDSMFRQIGVVTLATAQENKGQLKEALQHYAEAAAMNGAFRDRAVLGKARTSERLGDLKTALEAYREYDKDNPGSPVALEIVNLQSKLEQPPAK